MPGVEIWLPPAFLLANVMSLVFILNRSKQQDDDARTVDQKDLRIESQDSEPWTANLNDALGWEFEYARVTASEAMRDRHLMLNFHTILIGIAISGLLGYYTKSGSDNPLVGIALLWLLSVIGGAYFLILIRLRQAWYESALAMNRIKEFVMTNCSVPRKSAAIAFRWGVGTLPPANKRWNVFFFTALLIAFLNSMSYLIGAVLLVGWPNLPAKSPDLDMWLWFAALSIGFFAFHVYLYNAFLKDA